MKHENPRTIRILIACFLALAIWTSSAGNVRAETAYYKQLTGQYGQSTARDMLTLVNQFRTGSEAWYWNEENTQQIYVNNLQPLKYDYDLERVAMLRAAEIAVSFSHTRPNGESCFTAYSDCNYGFCYAKGENIAYGYTTAQAVFTAWREDDDDYSGQGHRRNMLSNYFGAIGIGHFYYNGRHYWVQEFSDSPHSEVATTANDGQTTVMVQTQSGQGVECAIVNSDSFPDSTLMNLVNDTADANHDGILTPDEAATVTSIQGNITSDDGLEFFPELQSLTCSGGGLTTLDVSQNTALTYLDCTSNSITTLDVSNVPALRDAVIYGERSSVAGKREEKAVTSVCYVSEMGTLKVDRNVQIITGVDNAPVLMSSAAAALDGKIGLAFRVKLPLEVRDNAANTYAMLTLNGTTTRKEMTDIVAGGRNSDGTYRVALYLPAAQYADNVKLEFYQGTSRIPFQGSSGTDYTNTGVTYSVKRYIDAVKRSGTDGEKALAIALEDYCAAAQIFFVYENDNQPSISSAINNVQQSDLQRFKSVRSGSIPDKIESIYFNASFESDNAMKVIINFVDGKKPKNYEYYVDDQQANLSGTKGKGYYLRVRNVPAAHLDQKHEFKIVGGGKTYTIKCSVLTYANSTAFSADQEQNARNLAKALYLYCKAAKTYFNIPFEE